jgi:hypothetical protein
MKKLLLILTLLTTSVHAEEWLETRNEVGGKILFLLSHCGNDKDSGRMVIATIPNGDTVNGCWFYFADMIHVVWTGQGGKTSSFDPKKLDHRKTP